MFNDLPGFNYGWFLTFVQMVFMTIFAIGERMVRIFVPIDSFTMHMCNIYAEEP
jgi:hypothetical protein